MNNNKHTYINPTVQIAEMGCMAILLPHSIPNIKRDEDADPNAPILSKHRTRFYEPISDGEE